MRHSQYVDGPCVHIFFFAGNRFAILQQIESPARSELLAALLRRQMLDRSERSCDPMQRVSTSFTTRTAIVKAGNVNALIGFSPRTVNNTPAESFRGGSVNRGSHSTK